MKRDWVEQPPLTLHLLAGRKAKSKLPAGPGGQTCYVTLPLHKK